MWTPVLSNHEFSVNMPKLNKKYTVDGKLKCAVTTLIDY